jgi:GAF domain-containing protein
LEKEIVSEEKRKPVLDEATLGKVLEAAYVLQEHNRELEEMELGLSLKRDQIEADDQLENRQVEVEVEIPPVATASPAAPQTQEPGPAPDYTLTLAKIVETQHQIQLRQLELDNAMGLLMERLIPIARASGAAIGIVDGKKFRYRAGSGLMAVPPGTVVPMEKALCVACIRTGQVMRCEDVNSEFLLDSEECQRRGIHSLIAVPIFHDGGVVGGLELYYPATHAFNDQDVHTCQLMAGLVTEAFARDEEVTSKKLRASERAAMLEALEKLKPNLSALTDKPASKPAASSSSLACGKCGHDLMGEEQFCGNCGMPRSGDYEAPSMQSKVASLLRMQEAKQTGKFAGAEKTEVAADESFDEMSSAALEKSLVESLQKQMPELFEAVDAQEDETSESGELETAPLSAEFEDSVLEDLEASLEPSPEESNEKEPSTALAKSDRGTAWSSAASARDFLEQLSPTQRSGSFARFWSARRGDIYLAVAVLLVAVVLRWVIVSERPVNATTNPTTAAGHRKSSSEANLSAFERMLIRLGLAEAPPAPEYKGNPDVQVWVDLHTALYYCPGADLYGKTPKGQYASQRSAQLDQFEPAYRKTCD